MEALEETLHHSGGIHNYFQGATIHNLVINGNMNKSGSEHYYGKEGSEKRPKVTDEQVAQALLNINGKDQVLNNYQLWLGACCLLMGKYNFPRNLEKCCERINSLPYNGKTLALECKYDNIRKFSYLKFVKEDVDKWSSYQPQDDEKKLFYGCYEVVQELDKKLQIGERND